MRKSLFTVRSARRLAAGVYELILAGDVSAVTAPGQFVNIELPGRFLRRPVSISDWGENSLRLLVKEAGAGTRELVRLPPGTELDVLSGLGNGFDLSRGGARPVLAGGGIGAAPLLGLARRMAAAGRAPAVVLGFRTAADAFDVETFAALGCEVLVATEDGTLGERGFVTGLIRHMPERDYVFACGPLPMLKAVYALPQLKGGQFSFEARMACGFGACMGCSIPAAGGPRRVCRDGPIFRKEEIVWQTWA